MKQLIFKKLQKHAKRVLKRFNPTIVAITGSIGKTSAKEAIRIALGDSVSMRVAKKNYNNEIGVPLAILGEESPGKSLIGWWKLFRRTRRIKSMPDVLILEFGVDHPGDIATLCKIVKPDIAVITGISSVHAEYFENVDALAREKASLLGFLPQNGVAILNADDARVREMQDHAPGKVVFYGVQGKDISAEDIQIQTRLDESFEPGEDFVRTTANLLVDNNEIGGFELKNVIGYAPVMASLAALCVARELDVPLTTAIKRLRTEMKSVAGRLNPIAGIKGSLIIDDSYNAAPAAMQNGLNVLRAFKPGEEYDRRIAALGQMAELGQYSEDEHRLIGMKVAEVADLFVAVGEQMQTAVAAAKEAGMNPEAIQWFATSTEAGKYLDRAIQQGDVLYVKGSQSARMEKVVKDVMAEPLRASELLVRQEEKWLKTE